MSPVPSPRNNEDENTFIQRCMTDNVMTEEYDEDQRYAICQSQWRREKNMERKYYKFELKESNEEEGTFTGYASTFTGLPDAYGDVVDRGAFKKTIQENRGRIKILWNHDAFEPIGKPIELIEDDNGLFVKGKLTLGVQRAKEVLALMKDGVINEMSIGYKTITEKMVDGIRHLKEVKLFDVSPVTFAANPTAQILDVKNLERSIRNNDITPVENAIKSLQTLMEQIKPEEPHSTLKDDTDSQAVDMVLDSILMEINGFDIEEANSRIDAAIIKLNGGN